MVCVGTQCVPGVATRVRWPQDLQTHFFVYTPRDSTVPGTLGRARGRRGQRRRWGAPPRRPCGWRCSACTSGTKSQETQILRKTELSKGDLQRNSRSQCPTCSMLVLCVPIGSHCGALALCRLSLGLDQPRRLPSRDQVEVASCQSSAQWPRSQARLSPNLRSPRSSST